MARTRYTWHAPLGEKEHSASVFWLFLMFPEPPASLVEWAVLAIDAYNFGMPAVRAGLVRPSPLFSDVAKVVAHMRACQKRLQHFTAGTQPPAYMSGPRFAALLPDDEVARLTREHQLRRQDARDQARRRRLQRRVRVLERRAVVVARLRAAPQEPEAPSTPVRGA